MGMSTHVVGIRPADERFRKMKAIWDQCTEAHILPPKEVIAFFNDEKPDERGVKVALPKECLREFSADMSEGYEVDVTKLPKDVTVLRFYNSW